MEWCRFANRAFNLSFAIRAEDVTDKPDTVRVMMINGSEWDFCGDEAATIRRRLFAADPPRDAPDWPEPADEGEGDEVSDRARLIEAPWSPPGGPPAPPSALRSPATVPGDPAS